MQNKHLHFVVGLIIVSYSLYYSFKDVSTHDILNALHLINSGYVFPAVLMVVISFFFRAVRWHYLISSVKTVKTSRLYSPLMVGFMGNILPARAGEFIRAYLLSKKEHISYSSSLSTIFIERLFDLFIVLLLITWLLFFNADIFSNADSGGRNLKDYIFDFGFISFVACLFIFLFAVFFQYRNAQTMKLVNFCIKPFPETWRGKIRRMLNSFVEGLAVVKNRRRFFLVMLYSFLISVAVLGAFYFLYRAFKIDTMLPVVTSIILLSLTIDIFITVFPTPGFLGSFHAACIVALHEIYNVPKAVALSYAIVAWLVFMGFAIVVGAGFAIKDNISMGEFSAGKKNVQ